jgi:AcrR family transcriptional regulator
MARAKVTPARVVEEAGAVADEVGLERLTLAAVADRLDVTLPSLYKHVRGMDALRRELTLLGLRELAERLSTAGVGKAGEDALRGICNAYREYALRRPGVVAATVMAPAPDDAEHLTAGTRAVDVLRSALVGYRLTELDMVDAIRTLRAALHGFTSLESAGGFGLPHSVDATFDRVVDALHSAFSQLGARAP